MTVETFLNGRVTLHSGDSREVLKGIPDCSIDSVVCDPPYALVSVIQRFGNSPRSETTENIENPYGRTGRGFMGQKWDTGETAFATLFWAEVLRVLKPGGHVVAFSGTRTVHRLVCAIEDAGFEIRDQLQWLYGSGFPKSHDVSKGMAKRRSEDEAPVRVVCRFIRSAMDKAGLKSRDLTSHFGDCNARLIDHWAARDTDSQPSLPTPGQWQTLVQVLGLAGDDAFTFIDREVARLNDRKGTHGERWANAEIVGEVASSPAGFGDLRFDGDRTIRDLDAEAAQWQGWGTALKPAVEPICLARKPLIGTVAGNVLAHGTGAINITGCRVGTDDTRNMKVGGKNDFPNEDDAWKPKAVMVGSECGRWPANVIHDGSDEVLAAFPTTESGSRAPGQYGGMGYGGAGSWEMPGVDGDAGSAARFFYTAKADADDRLGSKHPTVKPVDLMQWLCRLVTPKGGTVLDPFAGTGTTGEAAFREGFNAVLIERETEYQADIRRRMALVMSGPEERKRESIKAKLGAVPFEAGSLFSGLEAS